MKSGFLFVAVIAGLGLTACTAATFSATQKNASRLESASSDGEGQLSQLGDTPSSMQAVPRCGCQADGAQVDLQSVLNPASVASQNGTGNVGIGNGNNNTGNGNGNGNIGNFNGNNNTGNGNGNFNCGNNNGNGNGGNNNGNYNGTDGNGNNFSTSNNGNGPSNGNLAAQCCRCLLSDGSSVDTTLHNCFTGVANAAAAPSAALCAAGG